MPNEPRNKTGRSLREQLSAAAKATAEEQSARKSKKTEDKKVDFKSKAKKAKTSKRHASKEQAEEAKERSRKSDSDKKLNVRAAVVDFLNNMSLPIKILGAFVLVLALSAVILYPIGCTYYQALRQEQRDQAELNAVNERNEMLEKENKELETSEGIENEAREEFGMVKKGENATVVTNNDGKSESELPEQVKSEEIDVPHTWYYDILDIVFQSDVK